MITVMKLVYQTLLAFGLTASLVHGGDIVTGQTYNFTAADFATSDTAKYNFSINTLQSSDPTDVYAVSYLDEPSYDGGTDSDGRIAVDYAATGNENSVTYEVTTPSADLITNFTFALNDITYAGAAGSGNVIYYQYSTDGTNFTNFFSIDNRDSSVTTPYDTLENQVYNVSLPTASNSLYVRVYELGDATDGDSTYYALWSNDGGSGGASPDSYIAVTVESTPEPGTVALMGMGGCLLAFVAWRRASQASA